MADGRYLLLAGTDNDYSVTQNGTGTQFDVWFDMSLADPYASSIQCPIGQTAACFLTSDPNIGATLTDAYILLPGVLHASADIAQYIVPVPEPQTYALLLAGLGLVDAAARRRSR